MAEGARELVRFEKEGDIGVITVDNPPVNAMSPGVPEGIVAALDKGNADSGVKAMVLIGAGRSNTTPFVSSTTKIVPTGFLVEGSAEFEVTIDKNAHVETGVGKPPRHESIPTAPQPKPPAAAPLKPEPKPEPPTGGSEVP